MEWIASLSHASTTLIFQRSIHQRACKSNTNGRLRAQVNGENDPLLQAAINAASLRFHETHRSEPIIIDPYAGCFVTTQHDLRSKQCSLHYSLATKFIDDKLLHTVNQVDGPKQVVLLTDGMDTRPYRLNWPKSTTIFDVSPNHIFNTAAKRLQGVGAKIPRGCLFRHVSSESDNIQQSLGAIGFNGNQPSIWVIQGLPVTTQSSFEEILVVVSSLAANGSFFLGELPAHLAQTEMEIEHGVRQWMEKLMMNNGFRATMIKLDELATSLGKSLGPRNYDNVLFLAEQFRFSDEQVETWRREFERVEEEADEEGFDEL